MVTNSTSVRKKEIEELKECEKCKKLTEINTDLLEACKYVKKNAELTPLGLELITEAVKKAEGK